MPGGSASYAIYDAAAREQYLRLGLRAVVDLRAEQEMLRGPTAWADVSGARLVQIPIAEGGEGADTNYIRMLLDGEMDHFGVDDMSTFYIDLLERRAEQLGRAYRVVADAENLPALVHCAAGKDRTGIFVALVLSSLGVPDAFVVEDYALTGVLRPNRIDTYADRFVAAGRDPEIARLLFEAPAASMASTLAYLDAEYGGAEQYLVSRAGVDRERVDALRALLLH